GAGRSLCPRAEAASSWIAFGSPPTAATMGGMSARSASVGRARHERGRPYHPAPRTVGSRSRGEGRHQRDARRALRQGLQGPGPARPARERLARAHQPAALRVEDKTAMPLHPIPSIPIHPLPAGEKHPPIHLAHSASSSWSLRDASILALLVERGMRTSELCALPADAL